MSQHSSTYRAFADQVQAAADIVDVVGSYVELRRAGSNMKGLCPFHDEKTPSFNVHTGKQIFKCFGCGKGGDVISFVREIERVDFHEALRILAERYGLEMPRFEAKGANEEQIRWQQTLGEVLEHATQYYEQQLREPGGKAALQYLRDQRGLSQEIIEDFRVGWAHDSWDAMGEALKAKGYSQRALLETGLVRERKNGEGVYDFLRGRVMFPVLNARGLPVAFSGRILEGDAPKYINTSETNLFHKGRELFGLYQARDALTRKNQPAVLVEGQMDVIACHQAGMRGAVASMGTALTNDQARLIRRYTEETVLLYDADTAGLKAILRALPVLVSGRLSVRVGLLPEGEDPDSYAKANGPEALEQLVAEAVPFFDFMVARVRKRYDMKQPEERVRAIDVFVPVLEAIEEPLVRDGYVTRLAAALGHAEDALRDYIRRNAPRRRPQRESVPEPEPPLEDGTESAYTIDEDGIPIEDHTPLPVGAEPPNHWEKGILRILIEHADARVAAGDQLDPRWINNPLVRHWVTRALELGSQHIDIWPSLMKESEGQPEQQEFLHTIVLSTEEVVSHNHLATLDKLITLLESRWRLEQNRQLTQRLQEVNEMDNPEAIRKIMEDIKENMNRRLGRITEGRQSQHTTGAR